VPEGLGVITCTQAASVFLDLTRPRPLEDVVFAMKRMDVALDTVAYDGRNIAAADAWSDNDNLPESEDLLG
jgi:hypothetical protein